MQIFYAPGITERICVLDKNDSRHCIRVLRMSKGDVVKLIDGQGNLYEGTIIDPDPVKCRIDITGVLSSFEKRDYRLHIAISPLKNPERFEWFIEKSVEIGVDEITPVVCINTEKPGIKTDRINNLIISAMKQSVKAYRPVLNDPLSFADFIKLDLKGIRMIAHCKQIGERFKIEEVYKKGHDAVILVGPEGDFSEEEIAFAKKNDFKPVHLGRSRLRTETAGVAACHSVYFLNQ